MSDSKSAIFNRALGKSLPDAVRIELNRLNRAHVRQTSQAACDEIEAKIQAIEAEYYAKAKPIHKPRTVKQPPETSPKQTAKPAPKKAAPKRTEKPAPKPRKKA